MATQLPDGVRLLRTLTGHHGVIARIGWSPDGRLLATPSRDGTVRIWDAASGECLRIIRGHHSAVLAAAFDLDGSVLATGGGGGDGTKLWNVDSGELRTTLDVGFCNAVAFSPHQRILATGNAVRRHPVGTIHPHARCPGAARLTRRLRLRRAFDAEGGMLATGSDDRTVMLWEIPGGRQLRTLDGHLGEVLAVAFHHGRVLASNSGDGTVRLWETESGWCRAVLPALTSNEWMPSVAFHPHLSILAAVGSDATQSSTQDDRVVHLWELDVDRLLAHTATPSVTYTTAKIVLVGESGVGKTGLGWRLAQGEFVEHSSTYGQRFWLLDELCGSERTARSARPSCGTSPGSPITG